MRKNWGISSGAARPFGDRRWLVPFLASLLVTATIFLAALFGLFSPPYPGGDAVLFDLVSLDTWDDDAAPSNDGARSVESRTKKRLLDDNDDDDNPDDAALNSDASDAEPPRIAYLLEGTKGDGQRMRRTLQAIYHPRNQYILHLDLEAPPRERIDLAMYVKGDPTFSQVGNVRVIAKGNLVTYKGPTMVACTLHAVAILIKEGLEWDWFINLSASDYPLMTQDDILHVFSSLPRNLNFIEHFQLSGWKLMQRARPIVVDPGLYLSKKFDLTMTTERRELPTSFKLYTGSAWVMLTRSFLEYCIWGWDNLPRDLLMYYVNFISSPEGYFQTVICNSDEFRRTAVVGHDLHYIAWDYPPRQHPRVLSVTDYAKMVASGSPFARKFPRDDSGTAGGGVLDRIDRELLHRSDGRFTPGAWCDGSSSDDDEDPCLTIRGGEDSVLDPGPGAERLRGLMRRVLSSEYRNGSCSSLAYNQTKRDWYLPKRSNRG